MYKPNSYFLYGRIIFSRLFKIQTIIYSKLYILVIFQYNVRQKNNRANASYIVKHYITLYEKGLYYINYTTFCTLPILYGTI